MNFTSSLAWVALGAAILGTWSLLYFSVIAPKAIPSRFTWKLVENEFLDSKLKYQIITLLVALLVLAITYVCVPSNAAHYYKFGNLHAPAQAVSWLDIKTTDTWSTIGRNFAVVISFITALFVYLNVIRGRVLNSQFLRYIPYLLLLAALNAFTEEALTRLSVVSALDGNLSRPLIYLVSALIFAIPHYYGTPGGSVGSLMAGFLGWLLAKSVAESEGLFWAWFIHFLQDVIIFIGLFLVAL